MNKTILYNPAISSTNIGDHIIAESSKKNLERVIKDTFVIEVSTHLPLSFYYLRYISNANLKFVLGSNLLKSTFFGFKRQWNVTLRMSRMIGPCVLIGAGWWQYGNKPNFYTKVLLKSLLSKKYIHSVRDEYTLNMLKSIGIHNVINTACPTMWSLTPDHCNKICKTKSHDVIFTLTDYNKDIEKDFNFIQILIKNYKDVFFWPQGVGDLDYLKSIMGNDFQIIILKPTLEDFDRILDYKDIEYIGTRLHGGIRALQKGKRTCIIGIDNRALEMRNSFNLPVLERTDITNLELIINNEVNIDIKLPINNINLWRNQFEE